MRLFGELLYKFNQTIATALLTERIQEEDLGDVLEDFQSIEAIVETLLTDEATCRSDYLLLAHAWYLRYPNVEQCCEFLSRAHIYMESFTG